MLWKRPFLESRPDGRRGIKKKALGGMKEEKECTQNHGCISVRSVCMLCGCGTACPFWSKDFQMVICDGCGLVYMHPVDWSSLEDFYMNRYEYGKLGSTVYPESSPWDHDRADWIMQAMRNEIGTPRVLEIGCNAGALLSLLKSKGCDVVGIEPGTDASEYARTVRGLDVQTAFWDEQLEIEASVFDAVVMISVLEHFQYPIAALEKCWHVLKSGGLVFVEIPNLEHEKGFFIDFTWHGYAPTEEHLFCYSKGTISALFAKAGFDVVAVVETRELLRVTAMRNESSALLVSKNNYNDPVKIRRLLEFYRVSLRRRRMLHIIQRIAESVIIHLMPKSIVQRLRMYRVKRIGRGGQN
ncbi:MAG: class I SAM-dependent methyltransferase [Lentisphaerae bacterium]|nr:class I SAM-dependent methyltransferase [Lentisphaerota bacterium]